MRELIRSNLKFLLPILVLIGSIPLALKLVPPNGLYGMRVAKTYSSPELWYAGNRICGIYMIIASLVALIVGVVLSRIGVGRGATLGAVLAIIAAGVIAVLVRVQTL